MTYHIDHGPDGTVLHGTVKGDPITPLLRRTGWLFSRRRDAWVLNSTWNRGTRDARVEATVAVLRRDGYTVDLDAEDGPTMATVADVAAAEAVLRDRELERAARHEARAERRTAEAEAHDATFSRISDSIPMGQPLLVGHHSERRHRKDLDRLGRALSGSVEASREAQDADRRAAATVARVASRDTMPQMRSRLDRLATERRDLDRKITGEVTAHDRRNHAAIVGYGEPQPNPATGAYRVRLTVRLTEVDAQISYWTGKVTEAEATGEKVWTRADFKPGDWAKVSGDRWMKVEKANPKNLKLRSFHADGRPVMPWALDYSYTRVVGRRAAAETPTVDLDDTPTGAVVIDGTIVATTYRHDMEA